MYRQERCYKWPNQRRNSKRVKQREWWELSFGFFNKILKWNYISRRFIGWFSHILFGINLVLLFWWSKKGFFWLKRMIWSHTFEYERTYSAFSAYFLAGLFCLRVNLMTEDSWLRDPIPSSWGRQLEKSIVRGFRNPPSLREIKIKWVWATEDFWWKWVRSQEDRVFISHLLS